MKKIILLSALFFLTACGVDRSNPEKVAEKFLKEYYSFNYDKAGKWAGGMMAGDLKQAILGMEIEETTPAQARKEYGVPNIRVYEAMVMGEYAYVSYSVYTSEEDMTDQREVLTLKQHDGDWYVMQ